MNALKLTEHLSNSKDEILQVLESLEYKSISYNSSKNEFRFERDFGRNPSSVRLNIETLNFICFSTNEKGNLYTLIMNRKELNFPQALDYVANVLNYEKSKFNKSVKYPFGGFYKNLIREIQEPETTMKTYSIEILNEYACKFNTMFFRDGINYQTQQKYEIGYDLMSNRITVPNIHLMANCVELWGVLLIPNVQKKNDGCQ